MQLHRSRPRRLNISVSPAESHFRRRMRISSMSNPQSIEKWSRDFVEKGLYGSLLGTDAHLGDAVEDGNVRINLEMAIQEIVDAPRLFPHSLGMTKPRSGKRSRRSLPPNQKNSVTTSFGRILFLNVPFDLKMNVCSVTTRWTRLKMTGLQHC